MYQHCSMSTSWYFVKGSNLLLVGTHHSAETILKIKRARERQTFSLNTRVKLSLAATEYWKIHRAPKKFCADGQHETGGAKIKCTGRRANGLACECACHHKHERATTHDGKAWCTICKMLLCEKCDFAYFSRAEIKKHKQEEHSY